MDFCTIQLRRAQLFYSSDGVVAVALTVSRFGPETLVTVECLSFFLPPQLPPHPTPHPSTAFSPPSGVPGSYYLLDELRGKLLKSESEGFAEATVIISSSCHQASVIPPRAN